MFEHIKIVLCEPQHPGNIGATARAMKNMGLMQLALVNPKIFPSKVASDRASGAEDVLQAAQVYDNFEDAIADCRWVFGTSARQRAFAWPLVTAKEAAVKVAEFAAASQKVAIIFGTEPSGLSNEQLQRCDYHLSIPTHSEYTSLNLAAAVQVVVYEVFQQINTIQPLTEDTGKAAPESGKASASEMAGLLTHFEETALLLGFKDPQHPKKLLPRVQRLFAKAQLETEEVNILRGLFKAMQRASRLS